MVGYLARDGIPISRDRVRKLMRRLRFRDIYQKLHTTVPRSIRTFPLPCGSQPAHGCGSGVGHGHHLHPAAERLSLPGDDRGPVLQARAQLEAL